MFHHISKSISSIEDSSTQKKKCKQRAQCIRSKIKPKLREDLWTLRLFMFAYTLRICGDSKSYWFSPVKHGFPGKTVSKLRTPRRHKPRLKVSAWVQGFPVKCHAGVSPDDVTREQSGKMECQTWIGLDWIGLDWMDVCVSICRNVNMNICIYVYLDMYYIYNNVIYT